jgi:tetratricopeptide (TPR) repeat protein
MPNPWAEEYLRSLVPDLFTQEDDSDTDSSVLDKLEDPVLELYALWQSSSVVQCFRLALAMLEGCPSDAPADLVADLIECADTCSQKLLSRQEELPGLKAAVEAEPDDVDCQADLAFALEALDQTDEALELYHKVLKNTNALCFLNHRDCLNNIGWNLYLRKQYEDALPWFGQACWLEPSPDKEMAHAHSENLEPPYKLALENMLLCLARLGRLPEAAEKLTIYFDRIGRLPRYETEALRRLGLDADIAFIRRQTEKRASMGTLERV